MKIVKICFFLVLLFTCDDNKQHDKNLDTSTSIKEYKKTMGLLKCSNNKVNYGNLKKGSDINQIFDFVNVGSEDVEIIAYQASCNCTDLKISDALVKPNDSTKISMVIETHDKSFGEHTVTATIKTNGQRQFYLLTTNFNLEN